MFILSLPDAQTQWQELYWFLTMKERFAVEGITQTATSNNLLLGLESFFSKD